MTMRFLILTCWLSTALTPFALAVTTTGTVNATLTLTNGCLINGNPVTGNVNFGTLDFGTHPATFSSLNATLTGATGDGIRIRCTDGATYSVQITGSNTAPVNVYGAVTASPRYLLLGSDNSKGIAYTLYNDAGFSSPITNNTSLTASGVPDPVNGNIFPVYGRVTQGGNNTAVPAGTYTDVINVQVIY